MIICRKCGCPVDETPSTPDYSYYCPQCDEDLYSFETEEVEDDIETDINRFFNN